MYCRSVFRTVEEHAVDGWPQQKVAGVYVRLRPLPWFELDFRQRRVGACKKEHVLPGQTVELPYEPERALETGALGETSAGAKEEAGEIPARTRHGKWSRCPCHRATGRVGLR